MNEFLDLNGVRIFLNKIREEIQAELNSGAEGWQLEGTTATYNYKYRNDV